MTVSKTPSQLDNEISVITGAEWLIVDDRTIVGKMSINRIKSILAKADVGLSNVDNTSDANKPISTATATALSGKANISHTHPISDVVGLATALTSKADIVHAHAISDVTNLVEALNSKSGIDHVHDYTEITGLPTAVTDAVNSLVPGLVTTAVGDQLATKSDVGHTHVSTDVTDLISTISSSISAAIPTIDAGNIQNSIYIAEMQW